MTVFIDSNIPMYVAGRDHPNREPSMRFLERVRAGVVDGVTSTEVLQEILFRYAGLGKGSRSTTFSCRSARACCPSRWPTPIGPALSCRA